MLWIVTVASTRRVYLQRWYHGCKTSRLCNRPHTSWLYLSLHLVVIPTAAPIMTPIRCRGSLAVPVPLHRALAAALRAECR